MNILIPTDFSDHSLNACAYALGLFGSAGNSYRLVHTYLDPHPAYEFMVEMTSAGYAEAVEDMAAFVERFRVLPGGADAVLVTEVVKGALPPVLAELGVMRGAHVVVMGTQGASGLALFGSNAGAVARKSPVPVLVVPKEARHQGLRRVLLADDHGPLEPGWFKLLLELVERSNAHVALVHVHREAGHRPDPAVVAVREAFFANVEHSHIEATGDDVALALSDLAEKEQADLVAVLHRHMGFLDSLFHSSVTRRLAMHGHIPLLVLQH